MSLSTANVQSSNDNRLRIAKGVFAEIVPIKRVVDISGKKLENLDKSFELAISVELDQPGVDFTPSVEIFGNFARNNGNITDWGGAFVIGRFFNGIGIFGNLNEDYTIPEQWLTEARGKKVAKVAFAAGTKDNDPSKTRWYTWNILIGQGDMTEDELVKAVQAQWEAERERGYPKAYDASSVKESGQTRQSQSGPSNPGFSTEDATAGSMAGRPEAESPVIQDDDDLPF